MPDLGDKVLLAIDWRVAGVATDDAGTTIVSTAPDGTTTGLTVTHGVTGHYSAPLTFSQLGTYTVQFTAPTLGDTEEQTYEVTSDSRYFGLGELRAFPDMGNVTTYSDTVLAAARDWIEALVEAECGTSFVYKPRTETRSGYGVNALPLLSRWARTVTACSVDGVALSAPDVALLVVTPGGILKRRTATGATSWVPWPYGEDNVTVTYLDGFTSAPPADLKDDMMSAARVHVLESRGQSGIPNRATSITNDFGNVNLSTPGEGRPTGLPGPDTTIMRYAQQTKSGFA